jgi:undecaprenyl diphosphate synthase
MKLKGKYYSLDSSKIPKHVAIIMDGNRRWAAKRNLTPTEGHAAGVKNLNNIVDYCKELGVKHITVYALSTENWRKRAKSEAKGIFSLLLKIIKEKRQDYQEKGVKFFVLGNFQAFPLKVRRAIGEIAKIVKKNEIIKFNVALNYGGRDEIIMAIKSIVKDGVPASKINEKLVSKYLYTNGQPDPDLVIRTGGEIRISNFLLWQLSYSELYFTNTLWPDFGPKKLEKAILEYQNRDRRFGGDAKPTRSGSRK